MMILRVAVVQLTNHPYFINGPHDLSSEPMILQQPVLSRLAEIVNVDEIRTLCRNAYNRLHSSRLKAVLEWICLQWRSTPGPKAWEEAEKRGRLCHLIVFSEGGVSRTQLKDIVRFAGSQPLSGLTVLAGTHAFQNGEDALDEYPAQIQALDTDEWVVPPSEYQEKKPTEGKVEKINWPRNREKELSRLLKARDYRAKSVLPIVHPDKSISLRLKEMQSPFEAIGISPALGDKGSMSGLRAIHLVEDRSLGAKTLLPLVCSEALQSQKLFSAADVISILAYHANPPDFQESLAQAKKLAKLAVISNDGRFGGSGIFYIADSRNSDWWLKGPTHGALPVGDSILMADVDLDNLVPQTARNDPSAPNGLFRLSAIVPRDENSPAFKMSDAFTSVKKVFQDAESQHKGLDYRRIRIQLESIVSTHLRRDALPVSPLQTLKLNQLNRLCGLQSLSHADVEILCTDCILEGRSTAETQGARNESN
jgi:hypothetical protein